VRCRDGGTFCVSRKFDRAVARIAIAVKMSGSIEQQTSAAAEGA